MKNDISPIREYVLTHVPADERMQIYARTKERLRKELPKNGIVGIAILIFAAVLNTILDRDPFIYGYIVGISLMFLGLLYLTYTHGGNGYRPPTQEEMDSMGDRII